MRAEPQLTGTLVLPQSLADELEKAARLPVETAGVMFASLVRAQDGSTRVLGRAMRWIPESFYIRRGIDHMTIASEGYVPFLELAAEVVVPSDVRTSIRRGWEGKPVPFREDRLWPSKLRDSDSATFVRSTALVPLEDILGLDDALTRVEAGIEAFAVGCDGARVIGRVQQREGIDVLAELVAIVARWERRGPYR